MSQPHQTPNDLLKRIIGFLRSEGALCYIAGGYVRDLLLGQPAHDVDFVVAGAAIPLARRLADATGGAFYILDDEMDAARIVYRAPTDMVVDLAAMRGPDILADLRVRDFTINAMAVGLGDYGKPQPRILDPCGGQRHLEARVLQVTSQDAFQADPVRLLRAVRFAGTLSMRIEPQTEAWIIRDAPLITQPSAERIRQELVLTVAAPGAVDHLRRMDKLGLMPHVLPELAALKGVAQSDPHIHDVYEHTLVTVAEAERLGAVPDAQLDPDEQEFLGPFAADLAAHFGQVISEQRKRSTLLKFAAMLHDVGKPDTHAVDANGRIRTSGHEGVGAGTAQDVLRRLRFSTQEVRLVGTIVQHHMRPGWLLKEPAVTRGAIYRFFRDAGNAGIDVMILALADQLATRGDTLTKGHWREYLGLAYRMLDNYFRRPHEAVAPPQLVSGKDVMSLSGLKPGPQVGELLEAVREAQAEGKVRTREEALNFLQQRLTH